VASKEVRTTVHEGATHREGSLPVEDKAEVEAMAAVVAAAETNGVTTLETLVETHKRFKSCTNRNFAKIPRRMTEKTNRARASKVKIRQKQRIIR
jgi:hypothetical protein